MAIAVLLVYRLVMAGTREHAMVPGPAAVDRSRSCYEFVAGMFRDNAGARRGCASSRSIFTLFMFILLGNMLALIPRCLHLHQPHHRQLRHGDEPSSACTVVGFMMHGPHFLKFFVPPGAPMAMMPLLVPIEIISYAVRPISLSVRLFANMMAGHAMLEVFAGFVMMLGARPVPAGAAGHTVALIGFEFAVAFLQAYVFTVLTCIYLNDAIHMH